MQPSLCLKRRAESVLYLNQQLQLPVIEEVNLTLTALCHLQEKTHET